ncbi:hypothetical protein LCGC14_1971120, partial [marine sediment metagenome]
PYQDSNLGFRIPSYEIIVFKVLRSWPLNYRAKALNPT